ncbi:MAG: hypothetical protein ACLRZH_01995 [Ruthenibacterium lactatiformans]
MKENAQRRYQTFVFDDSNVKTRSRPSLKYSTPITSAGPAFTDDPAGDMQSSRKDAAAGAEGVCGDAKTKPGFLANGG